LSNYFDLLLYDPFRHNTDVWRTVGRKDGHLAMAYFALCIASRGKTSLLERKVSLEVFHGRCATLQKSDGERLGDELVSNRWTLASQTRRFQFTATALVAWLVVVYCPSLAAWECAVSDKGHVSVYTIDGMPAARRMNAVNQRWMIWYPWPGLKRDILVHWCMGVLLPF